MLRFIYGKPTSGKTYTVLSLIKELTEKGQPCTLIVPEQYTFEAERLVLQRLGDRAALGVEVLSFTRLCEEVARHTGGLTGITLSDCDKVIFMKRALLSVAGEMKLWGKYANSVSFAKKILDTVGEFKINAVTPELLRQAAEAAQTQRLRYKLSDIALIYEAYDMLVTEKFIDPADLLTRLYGMLSDYSFFKGKTVFLDSFKGFTGQQFKIIERIISQADDIYVSLTNDPENTTEYNIYTNIRRASEKIERLAVAYGKRVLPCINTGKSKYCSEALVRLEGLLSGDGNVSGAASPEITVCKAANPYDEAEFAAREIRKAVRTQGLRYKDFVIIARDAEPFRDAVCAACKKNGIKLFFDNRIPLSAFPLVRFAKAAVNALDFSTENILKLHKTGLGTLNTEEISRLENYTYLWNINGEAWKSDFIADPKGFVADNSDFEGSRAELEELNALRKRAVEPVERFSREFCGGAREMAEALISLFEHCGVSERLSALSDTVRGMEEFSIDALKQSYTEYMKILDSIVNGFGASPITKREFCEALDLVVSLSDIGVVPQMLDEVAFGSADRIRPSRPKTAFILGANQGVFPRLSSDSGLLNISERRDLTEYGIELADNSVYSAIDEDYLVYCNLCCPTERLYISYSAQSVSGELSEPSAFVSSIVAELGCNTVREPSQSLCDALPETAKAVFSEYCKRFYANTDDTAALAEVLSENGNLKLKAAALSKKEACLTPKTAQRLFGKTINMSASRFDSFNRCHFSFFCRYGLKTKKIQPADFDVMQRGTIVHYVLERFISEQAENLQQLSRENTDSLTDEYINDYLNGILGYRGMENTRMRFLLSRISRSLKEVVFHICRELLQSEFKPVACELKIGRGADGGELKFPYDGGEISLVGSIDRVDEYNGYIRIIDYKTGSKSFKLPDILFGLNLQMLIYLYAVTRAKGLPDSKAAAILYQPSKRDINDSGMAANGLLQSDKELITAMDKQLNGEYVPKLGLNRDGSIAKRCTSFIDSERFGKIFDYIERLMRKTGNEIASGNIAVRPVDGRESPACKYCDYAAVCGIESGDTFKVPELSNDKVFELMEEDGENGI